MADLDTSFYKIGSGDITWLTMLEYIARKGKPVILATGASTLAEVDEAVRVIEATGNRQLVLLQCITNYPSKIESADIQVLDTYREAFGTIVGYSDHSPGDVVVLGAVARGARVIEKHFTLRKTDAGPDHPHSMEPDEFARMIERTRSLERALGSTRKEVVAEEAETVVVQRRGLACRQGASQGRNHRRDGCRRTAAGARHLSQIQVGRDWRTPSPGSRRRWCSSSTCSSKPTHLSKCSATNEHRYPQQQGRLSSKHAYSSQAQARSVVPACQSLQGLWTTSNPHGRVDSSTALCLTTAPGHLPDQQGLQHRHVCSNSQTLGPQIPPAVAACSQSAHTLVQAHTAQ